MAKEEKRKGKFDDKEEEEKAVIELSSGDEDDNEANEDLSLKIVEKALLMRAAKLAQNDNEIVVLDDDDDDEDDYNVSKNDSGVVGVSSGRDEAESVVVKEVKKKKKKKKIQKKEIENQYVETVAKEEDRETIEKIVEVVENGEAGQLDENVDSHAVEVAQNMVLRKLLRGPRYFDSPDSGWSTCFNCGKEGHMAVNCPSFEKKRKPCFLCGGLDHGVKQCSKERLCIICKSVGHRPNRCPEKHKGGPQSSKVCLKCGDSGHDMFSCRNSYPLDDLKEIQCYICKNGGHLCCVNFVDNSPREVSCYKCGELGHTGSECSSLHDEATTTAPSSSCFRCGEEGHFAGRRNHEQSTPTLRPHRENKEALGYKSAPQDLGKSRKKRKSKSGERSNTTPKKSKQRGGWLTEDPTGDFSQSKFKKNHWRSPSKLSYQGHKISTGTTGGHPGMSSSPSYKKMRNNHWGPSQLQGSASPFHQRYSASRFSNSSNAGFRRNYNDRWY
ncbi:cellular nucleic acid binding protein, putative [Ricinus communis]|uniref:Cellular nucleic acid binding protein, putative n=1 Tax=Ricinus communis TaxID=3988 RepID=B9SNJ0_RICCO|nr:cellular nucleic acid binding protein, putative [Ricinus communis]